MSDVRESLKGLAKSAAVIFIGTVIGKSLALVGEILIVRSLSPSEYGHLALAYTIVLTASMVVLFGLHNGVTRIMSSYNDEIKRMRILHHAYQIVIIIGLSVSLLLILTRGFLGRLMDDPILPGLLIILIPFLILNPLRHITYGALRAQNQPLGAVISRDVVGRVLPLLLLLGALLYNEPAIGALAYWLSVPFVIFAVAIYYLRDTFSVKELLSWTPHSPLIKDLWSFSWPLGFSSFIFVFLSYLDILMIGYFLTPEYVGFYRSIQPLKQAATFVVAAFSFLYLPLATRYYESGNQSGLQDLYKVSTKWVMIGTFPFVLVFGLFSRDVVRTFFGLEYLPAASVLTILVFGLFLRVVVGLNGDTVQAIDRTKIELTSASMGLVANFFLNLILIPRYGINGAAIATVVGFFIYNFFEVAAIYRATAVHPFSINNFKPLLPTFILGLAIMVLNGDTQLGLFALIGIGVLLGITQLLALFITRSLEPADIHIVHQIEQVLGIEVEILRRYF